MPSRTRNKMRSTRNKLRQGPIAHLPSEILVQIFHHCLPDNSHEISTSSINEAPLKLGLICSPFRRISLSTPTLWTDLAIKIDAYPRAKKKNLTTLDKKNAWITRIFMERSGSLPVSVLFRCYDENCWERAVAQLVAHANRWESMNVKVPEKAVDSILKAVSEGVPLLRHFELFIHDGNEPTLEVNLDRAPRLHDFRLCYAIFTLKRPIFYLNNIRFIELSGYPQTLREWISHCPLLEDINLAFANNPGWEEMEADRTIIELPCLTRMILWCISGDGDCEQIESFLTYIRTPKLKSFNIYTENSLPSEHFLPLQPHFAPCVHDFLERSSPPLKRMTVMVPRDWLVEDDVLSIMRQFRGLRKMTLSSDLATDRVIETLIYRSPEFTSQPSLCPMLREVEFTVKDGSLSDDVLKKLIVSRFKIQSADDSEDEIDLVHKARLKRDSAAKDKSSTADVDKDDNIDDDSDDESDGEGVETVQRLDKVTISSKCPCCIRPFLLLSEDPTIARCIAKGLKLDVDNESEMQEHEILSTPM